MNEVELECAVCAEGSVIPVKIRGDAKVRELQKAIAGILSNEQHTVAPRLLQLYLAKRDGGWLSSRDDDVLLLKQGEITKGINIIVNDTKLIMDETATISESIKEANLPQPSSRQIHVLVELKEDQLGSAKRQKTEAIDPDQLNKLVALAQSLNGAKVGTILEMPETVFGTAFDYGLFIRQEYEDVYEIIKQRMTSNESLRRILVVGSPGIGKSVFGVYLLLVFMMQKQDIAYRPIDKPVIYFTWNDTNGYEVSDAPYAKRSYYGLFDGNERGGAMWLEDFKYAFVFASPRTTNYNEFVKTKCFKVYMNPWKKVECQRLANAIHADEDEWLRRYNLVGGKPRFLFSSEIDFDELVLQVKDDIPHNANELKDQVRLFELSVFDDRMKHIVFNLYRNDSRPSRSYLTYSSLFVEVTMNARFNIQSASEIRSLLQTPAPNLQSWRGKELEKFLLQDLATCKFNIKSLEGDDLNTIYELSPFNANSRTIQAASEIGNELMLNIPLSKTFPAIDGVLIDPNTRYVIYAQATVSTAHPIKYSRLKDIYNDLTQREFRDYTHILLFIVPNDIFDSFRFQPYKNSDGKQDRTAKIDIEVKQFVGRVDSNLQ